MSKDSQKSGEIDCPLEGDESRYRDLFEQTPLPMFVYATSDLKLLAVNEAFLTKYGYSEEEAANLRLTDMYPEEVRGLVANTAKNLGETPTTRELQHRTKDGSEIVGLKHSRGIVYEGRPARIVAVTDITERKRAEDGVRESERRLRLAESVGHMGFLEWDLKTDRMVISEEARRILAVGQDEQLLAPQLVTRVVHPDDAALVTDGLDLAIRENKPFDNTHRLLLPDGTLKWVHAHGQVQKDPEGNAERLIGTIVDITERQLVVEALREREEQYQKLVALLPEALFVSVDGQIALANPACCRLLGAAGESELLGKSVFEIAHPDYHESVRKRRQAVLDGGTVPFVEERMIRLDGSVVDVETTAAGIEWRGSKGTQVIVRDITERKKTERALRDSQERYRKLFEDHSAAKLVIDAETSAILDANDAAVRYYGWTLAQLKTMTLHDVNTLPSEQLATIIARATSSAEDQFEVRHRRADGSTRDVEVFTSVIEIDKKKVLESIIHDITDRKRAEAEIRRLNRIYTVLSAINKSIVRIRDTQRLLSETCRIAVEDGGFLMAWFGAPNSDTHKIEVLTSFGLVDNYLDVIDIDLRDEKRNKSPAARVVTSGSYVVSNNIEQDETMDLWREEASRRGYRSAAVFPIKVSGKVWGVFSLYSDETEFFNADELALLHELAADIAFAVEFMQQESERKKAEAALRKSEELLRSSLRVADIGIYEHDYANNSLFSSPRQREIHGLRPDEPLTFETILDQIHPEDAERVAASIRAAHDPSGDGLWNNEYRIILRDGSVRWLLGFAETSFEGDGNERHAVRTVGAILDITDHREAKERLQLSDQIINRVNSLILIADADGRITYASPSMKSILGYEPNEVLGDGWWRTAYPPDRGIPTMSQVAAVARGEAPVTESAYETEVRSKDGGYHWILWQDAKGPRRELIGVGQDITERKQAEESLVLSERKYRDIFELAPMGIYQTTTDGKFTTCNQEMASILGYESPKEMVGVDMANGAHVDRARLSSLVKRITAQGSVFDQEIPWTKQDGSPVWVQVNVRAVKDESGSTLGFEGFVRDITAKKFAEERLKQNETRRRELERSLVQAQKLEGLGTLASGIAHDFNNLLGVITGHAWLLAGHLAGGSAVSKKSIDAIQSAATRGAELVKQMLTFARKTDVLVEPVVLTDVVNEIVGFISETLSKTIAVDTRLVPELPSIDADVTQIQQVLLNLCVNARDAMPEGGKLTIETRTEEAAHLRDEHPNATAEHYVVLSVRDTGTGMDEETQSRVFEPFFTTKEHGKGTGLGLSLVFGIMQGHKGFVSLQSKPGKGTTFECYFPVPTRATERSKASPAGPSSVPAGNETVLVVEDEDSLRSLLGQILTANGYTVLLAEDGEAGLAAYQQHRGEIALVLSDLGLPKFGGDELYRRLRELDPDVRLMLASGYIEPGSKAKLLMEGVREIVQKPYSLDEVVVGVRRVLDTN